MKIDAQFIKWIKTHQMLCLCISLFFIFIATMLVCAPGWNARLSLAFTAVASMSTVATLVIAIRLYDRFGLKNDFVVKQADKIFNLFDILLEQTILAKGVGINLMIRANLDQLYLFREEPHFLAESCKKIYICNENYNDFYQKINPIRQSYWLPREIQEALDFLIVAGYYTTSYDPQKHIKLEFTGPNKAVDSHYSIPEQTLGEFIGNMISLIEKIDKWLKTHSEVEITLVPRY